MAELTLAMEQEREKLERTKAAAAQATLLGLLSSPPPACGFPSLERFRTRWECRLDGLPNTASASAKL